MSAIFISHSSRDGNAAEQLRSRLAKAGHSSVFLDFDPADGIPAGRSWEQELYSRLRACRAVIVLCSEHSMASDWVFAEITHARALGKHIFPLRVGPCEIRSLLTDVQVTDLTLDLEEGYARLLGGLVAAGLDPRDAFGWDGERPPYPGLLAFQEVDAAIFFGRGTEIGEGLGALQRLRRFGGTSWLLVLGASGSGKSSLVRAGLLPRLRRDVDNWIALDPIRPLDRPFSQLALVLSRAFAGVGEQRSPDAILDSLRPLGTSSATALSALVDELRRVGGTSEPGVLLVVDQLEELLGATVGGEADEFLQCLRATLAADRSSLTLVATLRSDFLGDFQAHPALRELAFATLAVGPLSVEGFAEVVEGPARLAGIELEPGLVRALVADTETDDALPLLAFTLRELWEGFAADHSLTLRDYRELGGLDGSIARAAEAVVDSRPLATDEEADLRSALLALVRVDQDGQFARQPANWTALPTSSHPMLERLVEARLLISRGDGEARRLEVAHEALLRVWDRLAGWLDDDRAFLLWRKRLGESHGEWQRKGRGPGYLLRGPALGEAAGWLATRAALLDEEHRSFILASSRAERRRRYRLVAFLATMAVVMALFALRADKQRRRSEQTVESATDITRLSAARSFRKLGLSLPFGGEQVLELAARELTAVARPEVLIHSLDAQNTAARVVVISPDLTLLALRSPHGIELRSILDGRWRVELAHPAEVYLTAIEDHPPDLSARLPIAGPGRSVLTAARDGVVRLWSLPDDLPVKLAVLESPDREHLDHLVGAGPDASGISKPELVVEFAGHGAELSQVDFSAEGKYAISISEHIAALWRVSSRAQPVILTGHRDAITWAAFSRDEKRLVTTSLDRRGLIWKLGDPLAAPLPLEGHGAGLVAAAFSPDSERILTAASDRAVREWSADSGVGRTIVTLDCDPVAVSYSETPGYVIIGCRDGSARVTKLETGSTEVLR